MVIFFFRINDFYYDQQGDVKEKLATDTIIGEGPSNSCGPDVLDEGETYLIYGKHSYFTTLNIYIHIFLNFILKCFLITLH